MRKQTAVLLGSMVLVGYLVAKACRAERDTSGPLGDYEISVTEVSQHFVAAARRRTTFKRISQDIGPLLDSVWDFIKKNPGMRAADGHNVALYWDEAAEGTVEVGVQVVRRFQETEAVVNSASPGGRVATTTFFGPYSELRKAHEAVRAWCKDNGYVLAGPFWEVYGDWSEDPTELRTNVFYLLQ